MLHTSHLQSAQPSKRWNWYNPFPLLGSLLILLLLRPPSGFKLTPFRPDPSARIAPLAMTGGNPYVRALMRTISASEANDPDPYTLLYGGTRFQDLSRHPDQCIEITVGPNTGNCSTAAGRYQFITTTWEEKAASYHPDPQGWWIWRQYSFAPEYQDWVVYQWLSDPQAWNADIPKLLRTGQLQAVLRLLSGTWTSLGYGIEDNDITPYLEDIYRELLQEELSAARTTQARNAPGE